MFKGKYAKQERKDRWLSKVMLLHRLNLYNVHVVLPPTLRILGDLQQYGLACPSGIDNVQSFVPDEYPFAPVRLADVLPRYPGKTCDVQMSSSWPAGKFDPSVDLVFVVFTRQTVADLARETQQQILQHTGSGRVVPVMASDAAGSQLVIEYTLGHNMEAGMRFAEETKTGGSEKGAVAGLVDALEKEYRARVGEYTRVQSQVTRFPEVIPGDTDK